MGPVFAGRIGAVNWYLVTDIVYIILWPLLTWVGLRFSFAKFAERRELLRLYIAAAFAPTAYVIVNLWPTILEMWSYEASSSAIMDRILHAIPVAIGTLITIGIAAVIGALIAVINIPVAAILRKLLIK